MDRSKSCFNCEYVQIWNQVGTLEDPPDNGWECGCEDADISDDLPDFPNDETAAKYMASNCQCHEFTHQEAEDSDVDMFDDLVATYV